MFGCCSYSSFLLLGGPVADSRVAASASSECGCIQCVCDHLGCSPPRSCTDVCCVAAAPSGGNSVATAVGEVSVSPVAMVAVPDADVFPASCTHVSVESSVQVCVCFCSNCF